MALGSSFILRDVIANIPSASTIGAGRLFISTDENKIYRDNGSTWDEVLVDGTTLNKFDATDAPTTGDDSGDGYSVGSLWVDVSNDNAYILADATVSSAVWLQINGGGGSSPTTAQLILTAAGASSPTTNGAEAGTIETASNAVLVPTLDFDASTDEYAQWAIPMPDNWDASTITATFYWSNASGLTTETVVWGIQAVGFGNNDALDTAFGTAQTVTDTWIAQGDLHISSATSDMTIAGTPSAGDLVVFRVYRDTSADNLTGDAQLVSVNINYGLS